MQQLLLNLETVTVCNHWNLLEYNYTCTSADAWNAYLLIAAWTAFPATTIWAGYNFDRASYLRVSSRASIYKPLGWLRPRSDKTPRGIFKYSAEHGQAHKYCTHCMSKFKFTKKSPKFKVQSLWYPKTRHRGAVRLQQCMYRQEYALTNHTHIAIVMSKHNHNNTVEAVNRQSCLRPQV